MYSSKCYQTRSDAFAVPEHLDISEASTMSTSPSNPLGIMALLSDEETYELERFLMSDLTSDEALMLDSLDGYLTAIAIGPVDLELSDWLPGIWGPGTNDAPEFETKEQAQYILHLILRYYNGVILRLTDPDAFEPMFDKIAFHSDAREYLEGEPWALGFMDGVALCRTNWQPLFDDAQGREWMRPLHLLGSNNLTPEEEALTRWPHQREKLAKRIPASIASIHRYWRRTAMASAQLTKATQRSSRNIGSGKRAQPPAGSIKTAKISRNVLTSL
jgi:uncharacterized protein